MNLPDGAFCLTEAHIESFYRDGYFYAEQLISPETVHALNTAYDDEVSKVKSKEWTSLPFAEDGQTCLKTPYMVNIFEQVLGGPVRLWLGMYVVVIPGGKGLQWHQDNMYTHILGHMLNAFVALDTITTENAGLWISPKSHLLGRQENLSEGDGHRRAADPENPMACKEMKAGDAIIIHREMLHHSKENKTKKVRRAFAFQISAANCRYAETGKLLEDRDLLSS
ncbi:MAG: phytanoyl-CoA dioxygenase family protein [Lentisphaeria bacterium]|nr:phytanoyl-CoA dioxygenase family protein [Lentisphaeria bacterium]NQZ67714.1 phytanoyl-CoA dioxygenase family protein [Lentisphaeria bacterium]